MSNRGRPELFNDEKREEFTELVKLGHSRRAAAVELGVAPSTVSKRIKRDVEFADAVRAAEEISESELLAMMRKHCEKSWLATRWLLEIKHPQRYCKRKGSAVMGPSADEVFDAVIGVLADEIADDKLRARIEARLDRLAEQEFFNTGGATQEETVEEKPASEEANPEEPSDQQLNNQPPLAEEEFQPPQAEGLELAAISEPLPPAAAVAELAVTQIEAVPTEAAPLSTCVEKPPPLRRANRQLMRKQFAAEKRLRKLRTHDRKKQLKRRAQARRLKKARRSSAMGINRRRRK